MNNEKDEKQILENKKLINPIKAIITEDTIVETPQDIIDRDSDSERRNEFKKADEIIDALDPETTQKRKKRKSKEKEEFDRNLAFTRQNELSRNNLEEQNKQQIQEQKDRGIERGE